MAYRRTPIGLMFRQDPEQARAMLLKVAQQHRGNVWNMYQALGVTRRHLYRWLDRAKLWPDIGRLRSPPQWLKNTLESIDVEP